MKIHKADTLVSVGNFQFFFHMAIVKNCIYNTCSTMVKDVSVSLLDYHHYHHFNDKKSKPNSTVPPDVSSYNLLKYDYFLENAAKVNH